MVANFKTCWCLPIHIVLKINIVHDGAKSRGYIQFIDFTISLTEIDSKSAFDLESDTMLLQGITNAYSSISETFFLLKDSKDKFKLVHFGK